MVLAYLSMVYGAATQFNLNYKLIRLYCSRNDAFVTTMRTPFLFPISIVCFNKLTGSFM